MAEPELATVYGVVLNSAVEAERLKDAMGQPPYGKPPRAPVIYIKPPNTYAASGAMVSVPAGAPRLEVNAVLAVVFGRAAGRLSAERALEPVAGFAVGLDVCVPHASYYRPAIRQRCRDGYLPIGALGPVVEPDGLETVVTVNGAEAARYGFSDLVRPTRALIAAVSDFITFAPGDALLVGLSPDGATAAPGDRVTASIAGVGEVSCVLEAGQ